MDLRAYYRKIREIEDKIPDDDVVVVSLATPDGGKAGVKSEVSRRVAARMVVEGRARLVNERETAAFRQQLRKASEDARLAAEATRVQVAILPQSQIPVKRSKRSRPGD